MKNTLWVVAYDISDARTRTRVSNILKDHGERVQYSVFECWLSETVLQELREKVRTVINQGDDHQVRWYPLCAHCVTRTSWQGLGKAPENMQFVAL